MSYEYEAARILLSSPAMTSWTNRYFDSYPDGSGKWVDVEGLKSLRSETLSTSQIIMLDLALNLLGGETVATVDLSAVVSKLDNDNFDRFQRAMQIYRSALWPDSVTVLGGQVITFNN